MNSIEKQARIAGLLCLLARIPAFFASIYVPNKLIVTGDPTATANRVRPSEIRSIRFYSALFRLLPLHCRCRLSPILSLLSFCPPLEGGCSIRGHSANGGVADNLLAFDLGSKGSTFNEQSALPSHSYVSNH